MREQLLAILEREWPEIDFCGSDKLITNGIVDSITLMLVISTLGKEFGIRIPYEEITEANFNSVDAMAAMVERLAGGK